MSRIRPSAARLAVALAALAGAAPLAAQNAPAADGRATFEVRQGETVVFTERFTRTPTRLETEITAVNGNRAAVVAELAPDASVRRLEVRQPGAGGALATVATAEFAADSVTIRLTQGDSVRTVRQAAARGAVTYVNPSMALLEQAVRRARAIGGSPVQVPLWIPGGGGGQERSATVTFEGQRARVSLGPVELILDLDADNNVQGATVPSQGLTVTRVAGTAAPAAPAAPAPAPAPPSP